MLSAARGQLWVYVSRIPCQLEATCLPWSVVLGSKGHDGRTGVLRSAIEPHAPPPHYFSLPLVHIIIPACHTNLVQCLHNVTPNYHIIKMSHRRS